MYVMSEQERSMDEDTFDQWEMDRGRDRDDEEAFYAEDDDDPAEYEWANGVAYEGTEAPESDW